MAGHTGGKCTDDKLYCSILMTNLHVVKSIYVLNRMCPTKALADLPYTGSDGDKSLCRTLNKSKDAFCDMYNNVPIIMAILHSTCKHGSSLHKRPSLMLHTSIVYFALNCRGLARPD